MPKTETNIQKAYAAYCRARTANFIHIANERKTNVAEGKNLQRKGVSRGFPDNFIFEQCRGYGGLAIELKTETGTATYEQLVWLHNLNNNGYLAVVARSFGAAVDITEWYLCKGHYPKPPIEEKTAKRKGIEFTYYEIN